MLKFLFVRCRRRNLRTTQPVETASGDKTAAATGQENSGNDDTAADTTLPVLARKGLKVVAKRGRDTPYSGGRNSLMKTSKLVANTVAVGAVRSKVSSKVKNSVAIVRKKQQDAREEVNNKNGNAKRVNLRTRSLGNIDDTKSEDPETVKLQEELEKAQKSLDDSILKLKVRAIEIALSSAFIVTK